MKVLWICHYPLMYFKDKIKQDQVSLNFKDILQHPTTWLYYLINEIQKRNDIQLYLITSFPYLKKDVKINEKNITYYFLQDNPNFNIIFGKYYTRFPRFIFKNFLLKKIEKIIWKINPDIITVHGTEFPYGLVLDKVNYPSLIWIQGVINLVIKTGSNPNLIRQRKIEDDIFRNQKYFITIKGNMEEAILEKNPRAEFFNVNYPVSELAFKLKNENMIIDSDIVFVGAVLKRKGIEDLIEAVSLIKTSYPDIRVKVVGKYDLNYMAYLNKKMNEKELTNNFKFTGLLNDHNEVLIELKKSQIFVLPTHVDSGPRSVAESMAIGVPVISYNLDGLPAMIKNNVSGILVEKHNIEKLADAILELLRDGVKRKKLAEEAYLFAKENFYTPEIINKLFDVYNSVITKFNKV